MEKTVLAKLFLKDPLTDPMMKKRLPVSLLVKVGKQVHGLTRKDLKLARKELGIASENINGEQVWFLPEEPER